MGRYGAREAPVRDRDLGREGRTETGCVQNLVNQYLRYRLDDVHLIFDYFPFVRHVHWLYRNFAFLMSFQHRAMDYQLPVQAHTIYKEDELTLARLAHDRSQTFSQRTQERRH